MKKSVLVTFILSIVLIFGMVSIKSADAARWHNGTPKVLRGTYYTKAYLRHGKGKYFRKRLIVRPKAFYIIEIEYNRKNQIISNGMNYGVFSSTRYAKINRGTYKIFGYTNTPRTETWAYHMKLYSGHRVRLSYTKSFRGQPYYHFKHK